LEVHLFVKDNCAEYVLNTKIRSPFR